MIKWLSSWGQGIIVAIVTATIIEMILPNGSCKKYVRVVIGIYILFTIISPVISKLPNGKFDVNTILNSSSYEDILADSSNNTTKKIEANNNRTIKDIYVANLEADMKSKLKSKGYIVTSTYVKVKDDDSYEIEEISLQMCKDIEKSNKTEEISIENVNVNIRHNITTESSTTLNEEEKKEIKEYLSQSYNINLENIKIS